MKSNSPSCRWAVQPGAYVWRTATVVGKEGQHTTTFLAVASDNRNLSPPRRYDPLSEQTGLFLIFAATPTTQEGIRYFADRFGMLLNAKITVTPPTTGRRTRLREVLSQHCEPYEQWQGEIVRMQEAVRLWNLLEGGDEEELSRHVRWTKAAGKNSRVEFDSHPELPPGVEPPSPARRTAEVIASTEVDADWLNQFAAGDVVLPARLLLQRMLNRQFDDKLHPRVTLDVDGAMDLTLQPETLLAAMWLQFAKAVCEHKQYRNCLVCNNPFELSPETARTNRRFCSIACKNRSFRSRQEQARRLHEEGKPAGEIAEELGASVAVVVGWIRAKDQN